MAIVVHPHRTIGKSDTGRRRVSAIVGGSLGNLVEWYDFYSFTAFYLRAIALITAISLRDARHRGHLNEDETKLLEV